MPQPPREADRRLRTWAVDAHNTLPTHIWRSLRWHEPAAALTPYVISRRSKGELRVETRTPTARRHEDAVPVALLVSSRARLEELGRLLP